MEELLDYIDKATSVEDRHWKETSSFPGSQYQSVIRFHGQPILPPLMTSKRYEEMQMYRRQAMVTENNIRAKIRLRLLTRVQTVVSGIEARQTRSPDTCSLDTSSEDAHSYVSPEEEPNSRDNDYQVLSLGDGPGESDGVEGSDVGAASREGSDEGAATREGSDEGAASREVMTKSPLAPRPSRQLSKADDNSPEATPSPRTPTKDSGVFSKESRAAAAQEPDARAGDTAGDVDGTDESERLLDTMADVTDLSGDEEGETPRVSGHPSSGFRAADDAAHTRRRHDNDSVSEEEEDDTTTLSAVTLTPVLRPRDVNDASSSPDSDNGKRASRGECKRSGSDVQSEVRTTNRAIMSPRGHGPDTSGDNANDNANALRDVNANAVDDTHVDCQGALPVNLDVGTEADPGPVTCKEVSAGDDQPQLAVGSPSDNTSNSGVSSSAVITLDDRVKPGGEDPGAGKDAGDTGQDSGQVASQAAAASAVTKSTSDSSATTTSSDDLQRTIISREGAAPAATTSHGVTESGTVTKEIVDPPRRATCRPLAESDGTPTDACSEECSSDGDEDADSSVVTVGTEEEGHTRMRTPLLNKVALVFDTPESASGYRSEQHENRWNLEGSPRSGDVTEGGPRAGDVTEGGPRAGDVTEWSPRAGKAPEGSPRAGDVTVGGPRAGDVAEGGPRAGDVTEGNPRAGDVTEEGPRASDVTEGGPRAGEGTEGGPRAGEVTEEGPRACDVTEGGPRAGEGTEGGPRAGEVTEEGPRAGEGIPRANVPEVAGSLLEELLPPDTNSLAFGHNRAAHHVPAVGQYFPSLVDPEVSAVSPGSPTDGVRRPGTTPMIPNPDCGAVPRETPESTGVGNGFKASGSDMDRKHVSPGDLSGADTSRLYTTSTELAPYMATSMDTIPSSMSTLPHLQELPSDVTASAPLRTAPDRNTSQGAPLEEGDTARAVVEIDSRNLSNREIGGPRTKSESLPRVRDGNVFQMTSSMEDLRLKPVQRRLEYDGQAGPVGERDVPQAGAPKDPGTTPDSPREVTQSETAGVTYFEAPRLRSDSEAEGKEEHLQRYLQQLSHMPTLQRPAHHVASASNGVAMATTTLDDTRPSLTGYEHAARSQSVLGGPAARTSDQDEDEEGYYGDAAVGLSRRPATAPPLDTSLTQSTLAHEEFLQMQLQYFEMMKHQLLEQQQRQLAQLLQEQESQHLLLQQDILAQEQRQQQQQQLKQQPRGAPGKATRDRVNRNLQSLQGNDPDIRVPPRSRPRKADDPFGAARVEMGAASPGVAGDSPDPRPHTAPVPKVSFALDGQPLDARVRSPAGVFCNSNFPLSSPPESASEPHHGRPLPPSASLEGPFRSPSVLRYGQRAGHPASLTPPSILKTHGGATTPTAPRGQGQVLDASSPGFIVPEEGDTTLAGAPSGGAPGDPAVEPPGDDLESPMRWHRRFEKVTALAKGYLTRRLLKTDKVQSLINTIRDTAEFAITFQQETPIKKGIYSLQDQRLQERVLAQLTAAMFEIHEIFFEIPVYERMAVIAASRAHERERRYREQAAHVTESARSRPLSLATQRARERKKLAQEAEAAVFGGVRPRSAPPPRPSATSSPRQRRNLDLSGALSRHYRFLMCRALKPIQAQFSPAKADVKSSNTSFRPGDNRAKRITTPTSPVKRIHTKAKTIDTGAGRSGKEAAAAVRTTRTSARPSARPSARLSARPSARPLDRPSALRRHSNQNKPASKLGTVATQTKSTFSRTLSPTTGTVTPHGEVKVTKELRKVMTRHHSKPDRATTSPIPAPGFPVKMGTGKTEGEVGAPRLPGNHAVITRKVAHKMVAGQ